MLLQDARFAFRHLVKHRTVTLVAALTLAFGIGANTAIFTVVNAVLLKPLPYPDGDRLVKVGGASADSRGRRANLSPPDFQDFERDNTVFESMGALGWVGFITLTGAGDAERLNGTRVSAGFFPTLGVQPAIGREFRRDEDAPGGPRLAVITDGLWRRRFGADPSIVGRRVVLDAAPHEVIGVLPPWFRHPEPDPEREPDLYVLFQWAADEVSRSGRYIRAIGRLRPDRSIAEARAELEGLAAALERRYPETNAAHGVRLDLLFDDIVQGARPALLVLLGAVSAVLIIACANVANLLLASGSARQKEMAIRAALGAGRARLIAQLLTESVLLASIGGGLGLLLAIWATRILGAMDGGGIPRADQLSIDWRVLTFTMAASLVTGAMFGLVPALHLSQFDLDRVLRHGGRGGAPRMTRRTREALVAMEVALALVLLVGAGLFIRSLWNLQQVDPGFRPERVLTMQMALPLARYAEGDQIPFYQRLYDRIATIPGVEAVGAVNILPLTSNYSCDGFQIDARPVPEGQTACAEARSMSPGYFRAIGLPLLRGRSFADGDTATSPPVAIINDAMARRFWPDRDPIGQRITYNRGLGDTNSLTGGPGSREIVGVVGNVAHLSLEDAAVPMFYTPQPQIPSYHTMTLVLRSSGDAAALTSAVRAEVARLDKEVPTYQIRTVQSLLDRSVAQPRMRTTLLGVFAGLAVALALVGVVAVTAFTVGQRAQEIGVRMTLGAQSVDVVRMMVAQSMKPVVIGAAIGLAGAWALGRVLAGLLFGVLPTDPMTFAIVGVGLVLSALVASYVPARRAAQVDPIEVLRDS